MSAVRVDRPEGRRMRNTSGKIWIFLGVVGMSALLIAAFAHLLVVSIESQPECVPHSKAGDVARVGKTAAKSSC